MKKTVLLIITLDTKGPELLREVLERLGVDVLPTDVGIFPFAALRGDIGRHKVALAGGPRTIERLVEANDKGEAIGTMAGRGGADPLPVRTGTDSRACCRSGAPRTLIGTTAMWSPDRRPESHALHDGVGEPHLRSLRGHRRHHPPPLRRRFLRPEPHFLDRPMTRRGRADVWSGTVRPVKKPRVASDLRDDDSRRNAHCLIAWGSRVRCRRLPSAMGRGAWRWKG